MSGAQSLSNDPTRNSFAKQTEEVIDLSSDEEENIDELSEEDLEFIQKQIFHFLKDQNERSILSIKHKIEKEDEDYKELQEEDERIESNNNNDEEDEEDDEEEELIKRSLKIKNKPNVLKRKITEIDKQDIEDLPRNLEPLTNRGKQGLLMKNFNNDQSERYELYKRTLLSKSFFKKISTQIIGQALTGPTHFAISGLAKYFILELLEKCKDIYETQERMELINEIVNTPKPKRQKLEEDFKNNHNLGGIINGKPLTPFHVREAFRLYRFENGYPTKNIRDQGDGNGFMFR